MATDTSLKKSRQVREGTFTLTYTDTTSAKVAELPKNARILDWIVNVATAVAGGTTQLDVGISTDDDYFLANVDVSAKSRVTLTTEVIRPGHVCTAVTDVYANLGSGNTAGEVRVTILFSMEQDTGF